MHRRSEKMTNPFVGYSRGYIVYVCMYVHVHTAREDVEEILERKKKEKKKKPFKVNRYLNAKGGIILFILLLVFTLLACLKINLQ